jgi:hypothetical protein
VIWDQPTQTLPAGVSLLPTAGAFVSMAYKILYKGEELGKIERATREDGGHWVFYGTGKYIGRRYDTEEFENAIDYALRLTVFSKLTSR